MYACMYWMNRIAILDHILYFIWKESFAKVDQIKKVTNQILHLQSESRKYCDLDYKTIWKEGISIPLMILYIQCKRHLDVNDEWISGFVDYENK